MTYIFQIAKNIFHVTKLEWILCYRITTNSVGGYLDLSIAVKKMPKMVSETDTRQRNFVSNGPCNWVQLTEWHNTLLWQDITNRDISNCTNFNLQLASLLSVSLGPATGIITLANFESQELEKIEFNLFCYSITWVLRSLWWIQH